MTTVGIAYVDRAKLEKVKNDKKSGEYIRNSGITTCIQERIAQWYVSKQKYCHCEIAFVNEHESQETTCIAYGVFSDSGVFREQRTFSNPAYNWIYLSITEEQRKKAERFCMRQVGKSFDEQGSKWMPFWPASHPTTDKWWCASFTVAVLHELGFLKYYRTNTLDVDDIVKALEKSSHVIQSMTPLRMKTLKDSFFS